MEADTISAIASSRRREILRMVWNRELAAGEIAERFDISWPAVSQHIGILREAGLVSERREGRRRYYRSDEHTLGALAPVLRQMWDADLDRLASLVEDEGEHG